MRGMLIAVFLALVVVPPLLGLDPAAVSTSDRREAALARVRNGWSMDRVRRSCGSPDRQMFGKNRAQCWWYELRGEVCIVRFNSEGKVFDVSFEEPPIPLRCE